MAIGLDFVTATEDEEDTQRLITHRTNTAQAEFDAATAPLVQPLYRSALADAARKEFDAATMPIVEEVRNRPPPQSLLDQARAEFDSLTTPMVQQFASAGSSDDPNTISAPLPAMRQPSRDDRLQAGLSAPAEWQGSVDTAAAMGRQDAEANTDRMGRLNAGLSQSGDVPEDVSRQQDTLRPDQQTMQDFSDEAQRPGSGLEYLTRPVRDVAGPIVERVQENSSGVAGMGRGTPYEGAANVAGAALGALSIPGAIAGEAQESGLRRLGAPEGVAVTAGNVADVMTPIPGDKFGALNRARLAATGVGAAAGAVGGVMLGDENAPGGLVGEGLKGAAIGGQVGAPGADLVIGAGRLAGRLGEGLRGAAGAVGRQLDEAGQLSITQGRLDELMYGKAPDPGEAPFVDALRNPRIEDAYTRRLLSVAEDPRIDAGEVVTGGAYWEGPPGYASRPEGSLGRIRYGPETVRGREANAAPHEIGHHVAALAFGDADEPALWQRVMDADLARSTGQRAVSEPGAMRGTGVGEDFSDTVSALLHSEESARGYERLYPIRAAVARAVLETVRTAPDDTDALRRAAQEAVERTLRTSPDDALGARATPDPTSGIVAGGPQRAAVPDTFLGALRNPDARSELLTAAGRDPFTPQGTTAGQLAADRALAAGSGALGAATADEDASWQERAGRAVVGGVVGSMLGAKGRQIGRMGQDAVRGFEEGAAGIAGRRGARLTPEQRAADAADSAANKQLLQAFLKVSPRSDMADAADEIYFRQGEGVAGLERFRTFVAERPDVQALLGDVLAQPSAGSGIIQGGQAAPLWRAAQRTGDGLERGLTAPGAPRAPAEEAAQRFQQLVTVRDDLAEAGWSTADLDGQIDRLTRAFQTKYGTSIESPQLAEGRKVKPLAIPGRPGLFDDQMGIVRGGPRSGSTEAVSPTVTTAQGIEDANVTYQFRVKVAALDDLLPSQTDALTPNPTYPRELQPRQRDRAASRLQIDEMAATLNPQALTGDTHTLDRGSPIVGSDNVVESGNGRTLALRAARQNHPEKWAAYQEELRRAVEGHGIDPAELNGIIDPVLVRERVSPVASRAKFAQEANGSAVLTMSPLEQAMQDAGRVSDDAITGLTINETQSIDQALGSPQNKALAQSFIAALAPNERAALLTRDGGLNQFGMTRLKSALFAKVYPGEAGQRLTEAFVESLDPLVKNIEAGLFASLPSIARAESLIATGARHADLSVAEDISKTVDALARLKSRGTNVKDYLAQGTLLERELTPVQERLLEHLDGLGRSPKRVREWLQEYAAAVEESPNPQQMGMGLFGEASERPTKEGILELVTNRQRAATGNADALDFSRTDAPPVAPLLEPELRAAPEPRNTGRPLAEPAAERAGPVRPAAVAEADTQLAGTGARPSLPRTDGDATAGLIEPRGADESVALPVPAWTDARGNLLPKAARQVKQDVLPGFEGIVAATKDERSAAAKVNDIAGTYARLNLLLSPLTHFRNITSTAATIPWQYAEGFLTPALEPIFRGLGKTGEARYLGENSARASGMHHALAAAGQNFLDVMKHGDEALEQQQTGRVAQGAIERTLAKGFRPLSAMDALFKTLDEGGELYAQAYRAARRTGAKGAELEAATLDLVQSPTREIVEAVHKAGKYNTYTQDPKQLTEFLDGLVRKGGPIGTAMMPFIRTPINAIKYDLERSPLGLISVAQGMADKTVTSGEMADKTARALLGGALAFGMYKYAEAGNVTGPLPSNQIERDAWEAEGKKPYSVKIGDSWWDLRMLPGLGATVALAGGLVDVQRKMKDNDLGWMQAAGRYGMHMAQVLAQRPLLGNITGLLEAINSPDKADAWWERTAASSVGMYLPAASLGRYIRGFSDPFERAPQGIGERLAATYPGTDIPTRRTAFGQEIRRTQTGVEAALNPFRRTEEREGIRRYAGSRSAEMDTQIASAITTVRDYDRAPRENPRPTPEQRRLANRFVGTETDRFRELRSKERSREAVAKQARRAS